MILKQGTYNFVCNATKLLLLSLVAVIILSFPVLAQDSDRPVGTDEIGVNVYEERDSLYALMPHSPENLHADKPFLETPDIQIQGTYVLSQIYYNPLKPGSVTIELKDYEINKIYYTEQRSENFNLDRDSIINHTEKFLDHTMHVYQNADESRLTVFLNSYLYLELREDMEEINVDDLREMLTALPVEELKKRFLRFTEAHKRLTKKANKQPKW
jgi:hypothetical protein